MRATLPCPTCSAALASDQRYCVSCGTRVRARRARVQATLDQMAGRRRPAAAPPEEPTRRLQMPSARSLAASVLLVLGFSAMLGTGNASFATAPINYVLNGVFGGHPSQQAQAAAAPVSSPAPTTSDSGGGGDDSGSSSSSSSSASSAAPVTTIIQQVVIQAAAKRHVITTPAAASSSSPGGSDTGGTTGGDSGTSTDTGTGSGLPPIKHVWLIMLGDQGYNQTFGAGSPDSYLSTTLAQKGELVPTYYGTSQGDLANEQALLSGQGPNPQTVKNCPTYSALAPGNPGKQQQASGSGCVIPKRTPTLMSELTAAKYKWKGYIQGMRAACSHPALGAANTAPSASNPYATWRNPLVYFAGVTQDKAACAHDVPLTQLNGDLSSKAKTPNVSLIQADACHDGSDTPCYTGAPAGTSQSDKFLKSVVPKIMASPAYKADGMILITFAQAPSSGPNADQTSCCEQPAHYPNLPAADVPPLAQTSTSTTTTPCTSTSTTTTTTTVTDTTPTCTQTTPSGAAPSGTVPFDGSKTGGGGQVGLLALSKYVMAATPDAADTFNNYSVLLSIEQLFHLKPTGYAALPSLTPFGSAFYSNYQGS
ncbi:MAG: hypothetical protein J2O48_04380 [Solirubrobacterales bacterium]|nr:hypothetical protein [Solirubrobacterales bacterium]